MKRDKLSWIMAHIALLIAAGAAGPLMSQVEQPEYQVVTTQGPIEIRSYGPMIAAEVEVQGERGAAIKDGFRMIAAYIFGANDAKLKVAMTAPVQQSSRISSAPASAGGQSTGNDWTVRFVMPRRWSMETLPRPNDGRVRLQPIAPKHMLAIRFSGSPSGAQIELKTDELHNYAEEHRLKTVGEPLLAFYNPPWTIPFLRRNEVMLELAQSSSAG